MNFLYYFGHFQWLQLLTAENALTTQALKMGLRRQKVERSWEEE